jgi:3-(3-hydroxy-phenyl)propionate hydroxylase
MSTAFDVAVVGYGPTGALAANLLGARGLSVAVLEREADILQIPRAVHFDGEVMRIFQSAGLAGEVKKVARTSSKGMHFVNGAGQTLLIRRGIEGPGPHGWAANWYIHQPHLETVLRQGARRFANVSVHTGVAVEGAEPTADGAILRTREVGSGAVSDVEARYVIGCDGARSFIRSVIGARHDDLGLHQPWLVVDALVEPGSAAAGRLNDYTVQICDPARPMTIVYVGGARRRWEIMLMPGDDPAAMTEPSRIWALLAPWLAPHEATLERAAVYTFHSVVAQGWRRGPFLLAGDACHQTPPFLGQGMCAGLRDAANLAWKLDLVLAGRADGSLLDTYESERSPHVRTFIDLAVKLGGIIQTTDRAAAAERDRAFVGGAQQFDYPQPQLGPGLHAGGPVPVAQVFPQPRLDDGRLLDEAVGGRFALLRRDRTSTAFSPDAKALVHVAGVTVVDAPSAAVDAWLDTHDAVAVLLRPDGYVYGVAREQAEVQGLLDRLVRDLHSGASEPARG